MIFIYVCFIVLVAINKWQKLNHDHLTRLKPLWLLFPHCHSLLGHASGLVWCDIFVDSPLHCLGRPVFWKPNSNKGISPPICSGCSSKPMSRASNCCWSNSRPNWTICESVTLLSYWFFETFQFCLISHPKYPHPHIPLRLTFISPSLDPSI